MGTAATMGVEYPAPAGTFHFSVSRSGQLVIALEATPSRFGPRHCGQLAAGGCMLAPAGDRQTAAQTRRARNVFIEG